MIFGRFNVMVEAKVGAALISVKQMGTGLRNSNIGAITEGI